LQFRGLLAEGIEEFIPRILETSSVDVDDVLELRSTYSQDTCLAHATQLQSDIIPFLTQA